MSIFMLKYINKLFVAYYPVSPTLLCEQNAPMHPDCCRPYWFVFGSAIQLSLEFTGPRFQLLRQFEPVCLLTFIFEFLSTGPT